METLNPIKKKAIAMRKAGYSYNMISSKLSVSKSTLSNWLTTILFIPNEHVIKRVHAATLKSGMHKHRLKFDSIKKAKEEAQKDIDKLSKRDLFFFGIGAIYRGRVKIS